MPIVTIEANVAWRAWRSSDTGEWIASCDALCLTASGKTWSDLTSYIAEIQDHLLRDLAKEGEQKFLSFLATHGWKLWGIKRLPAPASRLHFDVPFLVEREKSEGRVRAA